MPRKSGTEVLGDATRGRTSLSRNASRRRVASIHGSRRLTVGVILKDAHLLQSLASGRLPNPISQTIPADGVLHCNLQVRRDAQKWVSASFVTWRNAGFRTMLSQGARWENRDDRGRRPDKHCSPRARVGTDGSPSGSAFFDLSYARPHSSDQRIPEIFTITVGIPRVKEAQLRDDLLEDCLFP